MERREFIKSACVFCAALSAGMLPAVLSSCAPFPVLEAEVQNSRIQVPLSAFTAGSVQIIRAKNLDYDIAMCKKDNGSFTALLLRCTHAANPLRYSGGEFACSLHGSVFNLEGKPVEGPATKPLRKMDTVASNETVTIIIN